jgi:hypothetical protein
MLYKWYEEEEKYIRYEDSINLIASRTICAGNLACCKYIRIIENHQRGTSVPDDMEQAHIKMTGQADNKHLGISFIYHLYSFLF